MIANPVLRSLFWMMGFVALIGNLATLVLTLTEMVRYEMIANPVLRSLF